MKTKNKTSHHKKKLLTFLITMVLEFIFVVVSLQALKDLAGGETFPVLLISICGLCWGYLWIFEHEKSMHKLWIRDYSIFMNLLTIIFILFFIKPILIIWVVTKTLKTITFIFYKNYIHE